MYDETHPPWDVWLGCSLTSFGETPTTEAISSGVRTRQGGEYATLEPDVVEEPDWPSAAVATPADAV
jgi:hypothetical protein